MPEAAAVATPHWSSRLVSPPEIRTTAHVARQRIVRAVLNLLSAFGQRKRWSSGSGVRVVSALLWTTLPGGVVAYET
uniref:Uncharacterized protein n=1 Tax=Oryza glumipatula TaxID=40148 RepID=A0A0E0ABK2_9ORYZ